MGITYAFLNASSEPDAARNNFCREIESNLVEYRVVEGDFPRNRNFDAVVISGSGSSVYWDKDWIDRVLDWTRETYNRNTPILGICFGAQVIAEAMGGKVLKQDGRELGYQIIQHSETSRLFSGIDPEFKAFVSHLDDIVELPLGACKLAQSEYSLHAFSIEPAFGVLFHPEYDYSTAKHIFEKRSGEERRNDKSAEPTKERYRSSEESKKIFKNFEEYVLRYT